MKQEDKQDGLEYSQLKTIADMIKGMEYGSVTIIVQDGKIIQFDKTEKYRIRN